MTLNNIRRVVFGTTEDDDGGGLREWHNGAGGLHVNNLIGLLFVCILVMLVGPSL